MGGAHGKLPAFDPALCGAQRSPCVQLGQTLFIFGEQRLLRPSAAGTRTNHSHEPLQRLMATPQGSNSPLGGD